MAFHATADHLAKVRSIVGANAPEVEARVEWIAEPEIALVKGRIPASATWGAVGRALRHDNVVFTSASRASIAMMRLRMIGRRRGGVLATIHGELDTLHEPMPKFPRSLVALQGQFRHKMPSRLRFVLLGRSIADHVPAEHQPALGNAIVTDHPYYFPATSPEIGDPATFGAFGNSGRAVDLGRFAHELRTLRPEVTIRMIGSVDSPETAERLKPDVQYAEARIIETEEYVARARSVRYAAWIVPKNGYRLRASATFLDALAYAKPILYTQSVFVDQYVAMEPRLGVQSADVDDMIRKASTLLDESDAEYADRRAAILAFRERFSPEALAPIFRKATGWDD